MMLTIDQARIELHARIAGAPDAGAWVSHCGRYRYALWRIWAHGPVLPILMLNPSTADASKDDPTIRRCIGFAKREGYNGILVVNLFGFRATDPAELASCEEPVGPLNEAVVLAAVANRKVLCGWGSSHRPLGHFAATTLRSRGADLLCLGTTKDGSPRHPLYVRGDQPLVSFGGAL